MLWADFSAASDLRTKVASADTAKDSAFSAAFWASLSLFLSASLMRFAMVRIRSSSTLRVFARSFSAFCLALIASICSWDVLASTPPSFTTFCKAFNVTLAPTDLTIKSETVST